MVVWGFQKCQKLVTRYDVDGEDPARFHVLESLTLAVLGVVQIVRWSSWASWKFYEALPGWVILPYNSLKTALCRVDAGDNTAE